MTREQIDPEHWRLTFTEPEALFIINVLAQLGRHYQEDVAKMPPALRAYWQGKISDGAVRPGDELNEAQETLVEARAELRSERLNLVDNWIRSFELAEDRDPWVVELTNDERDEFVAMLNDRRLHLAFQSGITEHDMEMDPDEIELEERRHTVLEIDILGGFIMIILGPQFNRP